MAFFGCSALEPTALEERFRRQSQPHDFSQMRRVVLLVAILVTAFALVDTGLDGGWLALFVGLARGGILVGALALFFGMRAGISVRTYDLGVFAWLSLIAVDLLLVNASRPGSHALNAALDVMALITVQVAVPLPVRLKTLLALLVTGGYGVLYVVSATPLARTDLVVIVGVFAMANALGVLGALGTQRSSRQQFLALVGEQQARAALEKALAEIRTLRGIIPICSGCRKVRADTGFWEQVEEYVGRHTDADFSHGLCPECSSALYPEFQEQGD